LCGRWIYGSMLQLETGFELHSDCKPCKRKLAKEVAAEAGG